MLQPFNIYHNVYDVVIVDAYNFMMCQKLAVTEKTLRVCNQCTGTFEVYVVCMICHSIVPTSKL